MQLPLPAVAVDPATGQTRRRPRRGAPRVRVAMAAGRAAGFLSRATGLGGGGVIGGRLTLRLAPGAAAALAEDREIVLVSGTNGKTTTSALLAAALATRAPVAANADGANTDAGLMTALAHSGNRLAVLETDEGWLPWAAAQLSPASAVLLNLTRDQLSRHHEVARVVSTWHEAMGRVPLVVANADDPNTVWPAMAAPSQVWVGAGQLWTQDSVACPRCGRPCRQDGGPWMCTCGLRRPQPTWWLEDDDLVSASDRLPLRLELPGRFSRANAAMAVAAAVACGVDAATAVEAARAIHDVAGRFAVGDHHGRQVRLLLAKNPAGWLETLGLVSREDSALVLAVNSNGVDGRDPSWLYDVGFDSLAGRTIVVTGRRSSDLVVRLKLAGVACVAGRDVVHALSLIPPGRVDVIADYTAFQDARRRLALVAVR